MKKRLLMASAFFALSFLMASAEAKIAIYGYENVTIHDDLTYDVNLVFDFSSAYFFDEKNWSFDFDRTLENLVLYDDDGILTARIVKSQGNWNTYVFDARYVSKHLPKRLYVNATGKLVAPNSRVARLTYGAYTFEGGKIFDYLLNLTVRYPLELSFVSADDESKVGETHADAKGLLSLAYLNPRAYRALAFVRRNAQSAFVEVQEGNKKFIVENTSLLLDATRKALQSTSLIHGYPSEQADTLTLSLATIDTIEYRPDNDTSYDGSYVADNMILLSNKFGNSDELSSVILHELAHYAQSAAKYHQLYQNIEWLREGEAVSTEIRYLSQRFPESHGMIPSGLATYQRAADATLLERWYEKGKTFSNLTQEDGFSAGELYALYGFVVQYYQTQFGEGAWYGALAKTSESIDAKQRGYNEFTSSAKAESLLVRALGEASGKSLTEQEIFFPQRELYIQDKAAFEKAMNPFLAQPLSAEQLNAYEKEHPQLIETHVEESSSLSYFFIFAGVSAALVLIGIFFFLYRRIKK